MAELVTLIQDGPLGRAGAQVWVDDPSQADPPAGWVDPNAKAVKNRQPSAPSAVPSPVDGELLPPSA